MKIYACIKQCRSALLIYLTHKMALPVLKLVRKPAVFPYAAEELQQFPQGTLGKDLVSFLEEKKLQLLPYYAKHDIKHVVLGYDTTDEGEGCLQSFMLGNGHVSFPVVATVLYGFITMPEYWGSFKKAYARGQQCDAIADWKWFDILTEKTSDLKDKIK